MALSRSEINKRYRSDPDKREKCNRLTSEWQASNRDRRNAYMRKWHAKARVADEEGYKKKTRRARLKVRYGITPEEYDALLVAQGGHCALCDKTPEQERYGCLVVDHCHQTGRARGLLCTPHNHALGLLGDNEAGLLRALKYLAGGV